jgi:hypothetical protein
MLGLIASFAIPRFMHLANVVRASDVTALSVKLRNAATAAHSQYVESGAKLFTYSKIDAPVPAQCAVTYRASPVAPGAAAMTDFKTSGC